MSMPFLVCEETFGCVPFYLFLSFFLVFMCVCTRSTVRGAIIIIVFQGPTDFCVSPERRSYSSTDEGRHFHRFPVERGYRVTRTGRFSKMAQQ